MFKQVIVIGAFLALTLAYPTPDVDMFEDTEGQQFHLVPVEAEDQPDQPSLVRNRRQVTSGGVNNKGFDLSHTQSLINNNRHKLDGTASASKNWGGPLSTGGGLEYLHKPSRLNGGISAIHTQRWGTDVNANAGYNFLQSADGKTTAGVSATYNQHLGGRFGSQRPNIGGMLNFQHRY